jgi:hypothetical protein
MKKKEIDFKEIPWDKASEVSFMFWEGEYIMYLSIDNERHEVINTPKALSKGIYEHSYDLAPKRKYS